MILRIIIVLLVVAAAVVGGAYLNMRQFAQEPLALPQQPFEFTVRPGQGIRQLARDLANARLLPDPYRFFLMARFFSNAGTNIKAGEYELDRALTPRQLLDKLIAGEVKQVSVTFIEGQTFEQMRRLLDEHADLKHDSKGMSEPELLTALGASEVKAEGLFFPDTYRFHKGASDLDVLKRAYQAMQEHLNALWPSRDSGVPVNTPYEALVLASVVEKETGQASERPQIAAVFSNRLRINMRLQSDPTVIYGMGARFNGNLTKDDLRTDTPYNSYTRGGLPPTPIAAPSLAAIEAVLKPAKGPWLYFVARGDGTHQFSNSLAEHNRAVAQFQK